MKQTGTCVRGPKGDTLSSVSWVDGKEVWVQVTIVKNDRAMDILLSGSDAVDFATALKNGLGSVELL